MSDETLRQELIEEVRSAARHDAIAVAEEGARLAKEAGLEATVRTVERADSPAVAILEVPATEPVAAVVIGRTHRKGPVRAGHKPADKGFDRRPAPICCRSSHD
ncbi:hypothetical protein IU486_34005 [Streptomyces gardneri]|uniref:hypothetical protein n=1 Tax=Nocardia sputi TaxID=2943705 RepID=UPI0018933587|nr:hypothetical protein [Nocardia sputi]MBF6169696.1 hypothetical protein [Streptomyces gardneri]